MCFLKWSRICTLICYERAGARDCLSGGPGPVSYQTCAVGFSDGASLVILIKEVVSVLRFSSNFPAFLSR